MQNIPTDSTESLGDQKRCKRWRNDGSKWGSGACKPSEPKGLRSEMLDRGRVRTSMVKTKQQWQKVCQSLVQVREPCRREYESGHAEDGLVVWTRRYLQFRGLLRSRGAPDQHNRSFPRSGARIPRDDRKFQQNQADGKRQAASATFWHVKL